MTDISYCPEHSSLENKTRALSLFRRLCASKLFNSRGSENEKDKKEKERTEEQREEREREREEREQKKKKKKKAVNGEMVNFIPFGSRNRWGQLLFAMG